MMMKQWIRSSYTKTNLKIQNNFFIFQTYILSNFFGAEKVSKFNLRSY